MCILLDSTGECELFEDMRYVSKESTSSKRALEVLLLLLLLIILCDFCALDKCSLLGWSLVVVPFWHLKRKLPLTLGLSRCHQLLQVMRMLRQLTQQQQHQRKRMAFS